MKNHVFLSIACCFILLSPIRAQWTQNGTKVYYNGGKVGIGTDNPTGILHIIGDFSQNDASVTGTGGFIVLGNTDEANVSIDNNEIMARNHGGIADLGLQADGGTITVHGGSAIDLTQKVRITNTGSVGIGLLNVPTGYKLAVNGKIIATELKVQLYENWPDYVFNSDYVLLPIQELENSIRQNGHLPGVPTAEDVCENGVDVGEMNRILLEKIEELTLYMLELKRDNDALAARIQALEK